MSDQHATSASASDAKYWKHEVIAMTEQVNFSLAVDEAVANHFEVVAYSCTAVGAQLVYSALMRRRPTPDEAAAIEQDRIDLFEAGLRRGY